MIAFMNVSELETIIVEPKSAATHSLIWLHGLGADGNDFVSIASVLDFPKEVAVRFIFPHAPIRPITINGQMRMRGWFDIYHLDRLTQEDLEGMQASQKLIEGLIQQELSQGIPSENIFLGGFSQGGAIALFTGLRYAKKLAGILDLSGYLPRIPQLATEAHPNNKNTPIFIAHGKYDPVVPYQLAVLTRDYLQKLNYPVTFHSYDMAHEVCPQELQDIEQWFAGK